MRASVWRTSAPPPDTTGLTSQLLPPPTEEGFHGPVVQLTTSMVPFIVAGCRVQR